MMNFMFAILITLIQFHQNLELKKMLPISDIDIQDAVHEGPKAQFITEPSTEAVLDRILPQFAQGMIYGAILDSKTAEHASSMTAMQNASKKC